MFLRLFLILTLVAPPLLRPVAASGTSKSACGEATCCEVVETVTCCGKTALQMRCGKTGGECRCGVMPGDPEPTPPAPRPTERQDLGPFVAAIVGHVTPGLATSRPLLPLAIARRRDLHETQALLCIWRT